MFFVGCHAMMLLLAFPPFEIDILAWLAFVPLFYFLKNVAGKKRALFFAYGGGVFYWVGTIWWLSFVSFTGMFLLALYLGVYHLLFAASVFYVFKKPRLSLLDIIYLPACWVLGEWLRGWLFGGFPWALLAYSQYLNLPFLQVAGIVGSYGLSFFIILFNVLFYQMVCLKKKQQRTLAGLLSCLLLFGLWFYGKKALRRWEADSLYNLKINVVQPNIPAHLKWRVDLQGEILDKLFTLTEKSLKDRPQLVVWPESALPFIWDEEEPSAQKVISLVKEKEIYLLTGFIRQDGGALYNSALLLNPSGRIQGYYDKLHLVPFGEYIPLPKIFGFLSGLLPIGDYLAGKEYTIFVLPDSGVRFSVLICFEDLFPSLSREFAKKGADLLINITNDAWFGRSPASRQHLQASVLRAVENRIPLVRCTNTGISAFIYPSGRIVKRLVLSGKDIFISGFLNCSVPIAKKRDFDNFSMGGDIFVLLCAIYVMLISAIRLSRRRYLF